MSYLDTHLTPGENVVFRTKRHWLYWFPWSLFAGWGVLIMILGEFNPPQIAIGILLSLPFGVTYLDYKYSEFAVTNRRVIGKVGVFNTRSIELFLGRIEGLIIEQEFLGRIFGYGTLIPTGATKSPFTFIAQPQELRRAANIQIGQSVPP